MGENMNGKAVNWNLSIFRREFSLFMSLQFEGIAIILSILIWMIFIILFMKNNNSIPQLFQPEFLISLS